MTPVFPKNKCYKISHVETFDDMGKRTSLSFRGAADFFFLYLPFFFFFTFLFSDYICLREVLKASHFVAID